MCKWAGACTLEHLDRSSEAKDLIDASWSVGWLVTLYFFYDFYFWTSLLLPKWSSDLKYGPCPPARDFGSRVSGLVFVQSKFFLLSAPNGFN